VTPLVAAKPNVEQAAAPPRMATLRSAALVLLGAGAAGLVTGATFGVRAIVENDDSKSGCHGNVCNAQGKADRLAALSSGDNATVAFAIGGVITAAGVALWALGGRGEAPAPAKQEIHPGMTLERGGARLLLEIPIGP
jgi:hypothetical protein